jgi:hypothetical protein
MFILSYPRQWLMQMGVRGNEFWAYISWQLTKDKPQSKKQAINHVFSSSDAPQVNILSSTYSVNVGSSVTLQCTISANPVHTTVYWKKIVNGVSTDVDIGSSSNRYGGSTVNSPSLIISNAVTSDEGFYVWLKMECKVLENLYQLDYG